jgi:hypothetical protein
MNLRRRLMQAWIAGSAVWITAVLIHYHSSTWPDLLGWLFGVPLLVLVIGFAVSWAVSGFRSP